VVKDVNSEIFENYKSEFDIKNEEIVNEDLKKAIKEEKNEEKLEIEEKEENPK
jgi:hypothetical protein